MKIKEMSEDEGPREKLVKWGVQNSIGISS